MSCCRRIVQLCRDCLIIVYQFAADAKAAGAASVVSQGTTPQESDIRSVTKPLHWPVFDSDTCLQFILPVNGNTSTLHATPGINEILLKFLGIRMLYEGHQTLPHNKL